MATARLESSGLSSELAQELVAAGRESELVVAKEIGQGQGYNALTQLKLGNFNQPALEALLASSISKITLDTLLYSRNELGDISSASYAFAHHYQISKQLLETVAENCGSKATVDLVECSRKGSRSLYLEPDFRIDDSFLGAIARNGGVGVDRLYEMVRADDSEEAPQAKDTLFMFLKRGLADSSISSYEGSPGWGGRMAASEIERLEIPYDETLEKALVAGNGASFIINRLDKFSMVHGDTLNALLADTSVDSQERILSNLHHFIGIAEATLAKLRNVTGKEYLREYPSEANEKVRSKWFGEMSYAYMQGGFNKTSIGQVIRVRIEQGIEDDIHDASQWITEFSVPEAYYDIAAIKYRREEGAFDPNLLEPARLRDERQEDEFFTQLTALTSEQRQMLNLSSKPEIAELMFYEPVNQLLYRTALETFDGVPYYKHADFSMDALVTRAANAADGFVAATSFGRGKEETTHNLGAEDLRRLLSGKSGQLARQKQALLDELHTLPLAERVSDEAFQRLYHTASQELAESPRNLRHTVSNLRAMGQARRAYISDTQQWLVRHAASPHTRLTKVWADRGMALAYGTADGATAIENWQTQNALILAVNHLDEVGSLETTYGLSKGEILAPENTPVIAELSRRLSANNTLEALSKLKRWREKRNWDAKLLPGAEIPVDLDGEASGKTDYTFIVLEKDDPRGFTIGEDTGCCMTIHGESKDCIAVGYKRQNAGFMAMYESNGRVTAQSFWYVHPDYSDTLVLDNIEANKGKDLSRVLEIYKAALTEYLAAHPKSGITKVNIGTGYTDVDLGGLKKVKPIPPLTKNIYTDARNQRSFLDLTAS